MSFSARWLNYFFDIAKINAQMSKDLNTQVGAVIVDSDRNILSTGFNGFPRGAEETPIRQSRPTKYLFTVHAEANAIAAAARNGHSLMNSALFCTHPPCAQCAALIVQAGITCVYFFNQPAAMLDDENRRASTTILFEGNVESISIA